MTASEVGGGQANGRLGKGEHERAGKGTAQGQMNGVFMTPETAGL